MKKRQRRLNYLLALTLLVSSPLALMLANPARRVHAATTRTVMNTSDSGAGSLRQAIADSAAGDSIDFGSGVTGSITLASELVIGMDLTITGPGSGVLAVSGNHATRVLRITGGNVTISGLKITAGNAVGTDPNVDGQGGALRNAGTLALNSCTISSSSSENGGIWNNNACTLSDCTITDNFSNSDGGGIYNDGTATIQRCTISNNSSNGGAGGIFNAASPATLVIADSTISGNTAARDGGGIFDVVVGVTLTNCTITGNRSPTGGGVVTGSKAESWNNTIVAGNFGDSASSPSDVYLTSKTPINASHCLIGDAGSSGGITDGTNSNIVGVSGSGTREIKTILNPILANNGGPTMTHLLVCKSPALNAGDNTLASSLSTDQRGAPRVAGGTVDIGAVEMQSQVTNTKDDGSAGSLRKVIGGASTGEIIDFDPCLTGTITLDSTLGVITVGNNVTVNGPGADHLTVSGNNATQTFSVTTGSETINGLTITEGNAPVLTNVGGAILVEATLAMNNCVISNSSAYLAGGAISVESGNMILNNCTITGCQANNDSGGGIWVDIGNLLMTNCTVTGNTSYNGGGGIFSLDSTVTLISCTCSGNRAGGAGGGIETLSSVTPTFNNCIVAGNTDASGLPDIYTVNTPTLGNNNLIGNTNGANLAGSNNITGKDPMLGPLQNNGGTTPTLALLPGSPAIDAGAFTDSLGNPVPLIDQRGFPRPIDGDGDGIAKNDIGAFEAGPCTVTALHVSTQPQSQGVCPGSLVTFTAATTGGGAGVTPQWQVSTDGGNNFNNITGATSATLSLMNVTTSMSGNQYRAVFSNHCNQVDTSAAVLTVAGSAPVVTVSPVSQTISGTVTFTAAATGTPAPTVQWQVSTDGGVNFTGVPGATSTSLTVTLTPAQTGYRYRAVFTNQCGMAITTSGTSTVLDVCLKDDTTGNWLRFNSVTGQYVFTRCSDGFTVTGTGTAALVNGLKTLTDFKSDRRITASFNTGQLTGTATLSLQVAQGVWQTLRIIDTKPSATCSCGA